MCVNFCLQDVQEGDERREGPQEHWYEELVPTLLGDEHWPNAHASSVIFMWSASQGPPQDRRPWTKDPQGKGSLPAAKEQRFHSHPHSWSHLATRNSDTGKPESSTTSGIWKDDHPSRTHLIWSWSWARRSSAPALLRLKNPRVLRDPWVRHAQPKEPTQDTWPESQDHSGQTCLSIRAGTPLIRMELQGPDLRLNSMQDTVLRCLLCFHERLLPRGRRFLHLYRQHPPRHPEYASGTWTTPGTATKMELGPRHWRTRTETRHHDNEWKHHHHDAILEHWVRPTTTSSLGEFLPVLLGKFLFAFLIYSFLF